VNDERPDDGRSPGSLTAIGLVVVSAALFGTTGTALAQVPGTIDPLSSGTLRLLLGGGVLALVARRHRSTLVGSWPTLVAGAVGVAVYQLGFFWAVTDTGVAAGTLVTIGISPIASRVIGAVMRRPSPPRSWYVAASILILGLTVMILGGYDDVQLSTPGVVVAAIAGVSFAVYTECGSRALIHGASPDATMAALFFGAGLLTAPLLLWRGVDILSSGRGLLVLGHLAVVTLALAYMAFGRALRRLAPTVVTTLTIVEPVVATSLSFVVLNEKFSVVGWLGAATVVVGLPVVGLAARSEAPTMAASTVRT
jgi:DME family drug/metabolite transporter